MTCTEQWTLTMPKTPPFITGKAENTRRGSAIWVINYFLHWLLKPELSLVKEWVDWGGAGFKRGHKIQGSAEISRQQLAILDVCCVWFVCACVRVCVHLTAVYHALDSLSTNATCHFYLCSMSAATCLALQVIFSMSQKTSVQKKNIRVPLQLLFSKTLGCVSAGISDNMVRV